MSAHWQFNRNGLLYQLPLPAVMGIINCTPDSFYAGSRVIDPNEALLDKARQMIEAGAAILDLGAESTRPGAEAVDIIEEINRLIPAIQSIRAHFPDILISADTRHAEVARAALDAGADIINDISPETSGIPELIVARRIPYIFMHMRGTPADMASLNDYQDVTREVLYYLAGKVKEFRALGITDLMADPGFGFAKSISQNFEMLRQAEVFRLLDVPILLGLSRKSMIYKSLQITAEEALNGSTVLHTIALRKLPALLRVHDVAEARQVMELLKKV